MSTEGKAIIKSSSDEAARSEASESERERGTSTQPPATSSADPPPSSPSIPQAISTSDSEQNKVHRQSSESSDELQQQASGIAATSTETTQPPQEPALPTFEEIEAQERQVIAVSASKGPAAFFNLARKFLATDEMCDLSALEGAVVAAVDAAHFLERSKLATIVRIRTSYVAVEPKRKKATADVEAQSGSFGGSRGVPAAASSASSRPSYVHGSSREFGNIEEASAGGELQRRHGGRKGSTGGRELRRARIIITVKRTEGYKQWLEENPLQAIIAGDADVPEDPR